MNLSRLPEGDQEAINERAGILEFDAGMTREEAERTALSMYWAAVNQSMYQLTELD